MRRSSSPKWKCRFEGSLNKDVFFDYIGKICFNNSGIGTKRCPEITIIFYFFGYKIYFFNFYLFLD